MADFRIYRLFEGKTQTLSVKSEASYRQNTWKQEVWIGYSTKLTHIGQRNSDINASLVTI
jgi:hypothetical protein